MVQCLALPSLEIVTVLYWVYFFEQYSQEIWMLFQAVVEAQLGDDEDSTEDRWEDTHEAEQDRAKHILEAEAQVPY
jgi:hypothetical protein